MVDIWEDLRKRARQLENHIDVKLLALNKLASSSTTQSSSRYDASANDTSSNVSSKQSAFHSLSAELEAMIAKLTQINDQVHSFIRHSFTDCFHKVPFFE
ncbi:unnamed protein product [Anisakis simplex]|uniref:Golgi SNAP receptor complex member 1 n=1 Tax=Anisakis simplex TaxID=6269 RepID=A0A0M3K3D2_ANISI|nr:unnamed protein product [Anisakis simplex]